MKKATAYENKGRGTLFVTFRPAVRGIALLSLAVGRLEEPDRVGFELHKELLNVVIDALALADRNL